MHGFYKNLFSSFFSAFLFLFLLSTQIDCGGNNGSDVSSQAGTDNIEFAVSARIFTGQDLGDTPCAYTCEIKVTAGPNSVVKFQETFSNLILKCDSQGKAISNQEVIKTTFQVDINDPDVQEGIMVQGNCRPSGGDLVNTITFGLVDGSDAYSHSVGVNVQQCLRDSNCSLELELTSLLGAVEESGVLALGGRLTCPAIAFFQSSCTTETIWCSTLELLAGVAGCEGGGGGEAVCGNGKKEGKEECDGKEGVCGKGEVCAAMGEKGECTCVPDAGSTCGNSQLDDGEGCDDNAPFRVCSDAECLPKGEPGECTCRCGNNVLETGDTCDNFSNRCGPTEMCGFKEDQNSCSCVSVCEQTSANEIGLCEDKFDNDCDGLKNCDDSDCADDPACSGSVCGDDHCDFGEECVSDCHCNNDFCERDYCEETLCPDACHCGNFVLEENLGEECDDGNNVYGDGCSTDCKLDSTCGDGVLEGLEFCDPPQSPHPDFPGNCCTRFCDGLAPCHPLQCGDGLCDGGKLETPVNCPDDCNICGDDLCTGEEIAFPEICPHDCGLCLGENPLCGNGAKEAGEECDDGNIGNGDGCTSECALERLLF